MSLRKPVNKYIDVMKCKGGGGGSWNATLEGDCLVKSGHVV